MTKFKQYFMSALLMFGFTLAPLLVGATVAAQNPIQDGLEKGTCLDSLRGTADCPDEADAAGGVAGLITTIINILSWIVGVVAVIMIILGGFKYITSGGDSGNVSAAKNTILYAIIGLVIVALAQVIVRFVLNTTTNEIIQ